MIKGLTTTIVCACLAGAVGVGLYFVKHEVKEQEARLAVLNREIQANQEAIHVLKAEWSYLNDPTRLRALSEKFLSMKVMGPAQVASLDVLPDTAPAYAANRATTQRAGQTRAPAAKPAVQAVAAKTPQAPAAKPTAPALAAAAAPAKAAPAKAPVAAAAASAAPARPVLVPGADTTPRHQVAAPAPLPQPAAPAPRNPAPSRTIVVQSPALASTPALPGEVR